MAFPIGKPSVEVSPGVWEGMTPAGIQRVIGASYYNNGIIPDASNARVKGTTGWAYSVPAGAAMLWQSSSARTGILVPWEATTLSVANPGGAARTDVIYIGGDGVVKVRQGATTPPGTELVLDRMVIPAGAANAAAATSNWDIQWAIPAGASLGRLAHWTDPGGGAAGTSPVTRYSKRFVVPMDSVVRVDLTSTIKAATSNGIGAMGMTVVIDGTWRRSMSCNYDNRWQTYGANWSTGVLAGAHTIEVETAWSTGDTYQLATGSSITEMALWHMGVDD